MLKLLGAELVLTEGAQGHARRHRRAPTSSLKEIPDAVIPQQFQNPANPEIHRRTTAEEIWNDTDGEIDVFVSGVGTGGTITGVGQVLKPRKPGAAHHRGRAGRQPGALRRQARPAQDPGDRRRLRAADPRHQRSMTRWSRSRNDEAFDYARLCARVEGIPVGISSGAAIAAAVKVGQRAGDEGQEHRPHHPVLRRALSLDGAVRRAGLSAGAGDRHVCGGIAPPPESVDIRLASDRGERMEAVESTGWRSSSRRSVKFVIGCGLVLAAGVRQAVA